MRMPEAALPRPGEREVHSSIRQISMANSVRDPELLYRRVFADAFQNCVDRVWCHTRFFGEGHKMSDQESFANHVFRQRVLTIGGF